MVLSDICVDKIVIHPGGQMTTFIDRCEYRFPKLMMCLKILAGKSVMYKMRVITENGITIVTPETVTCSIHKCYFKNIVFDNAKDRAEKGGE